MCSYCLLQYPDSSQIEHFEPQDYAEGRVNDPTNLLLGCTRCNGGKGDYHPEHLDRRRLPLPIHAHGYSVIDIRAENFSELFEIQNNGAIYPNSTTTQRERVKFNILTLLKLNGKSTKKRRIESQEILSVCKQLIASGERDVETKYLIDFFVKLCAKNYLFYKAFDISISETLQSLIDTYIKINILLGKQEAIESSVKRDDR